MRYGKVSRMAGLISAALVATVTFVVAAHAVQTIRTPNAITTSFSLNQGQSTGAISVAANPPTLVMGDTSSGNNLGLSDMTVVSASGILMWNGIESAGGGFTQGVNNGSPGVHMMFIDFMHCVDIEVNSSTSFKVVNGCLAAPGPMQGQVTEIW